MLFSALLSVAAATSLRVEQHAFTDGWTVAERTTGKVEFTIAVKQQNLDKLASIAMAVSNPMSPSYTNYMNVAQIAAMAAPTAADLATVTGWLHAYQIK